MGLQTSEVGFSIIMKITWARDNREMFSYPTKKNFNAKDLEYQSMVQAIASINVYKLSEDWNIYL